MRADGHAKASKFKGHIKFEDCHFRYPTEKQKPVLRGISFEIKPGEKVGPYRYYYLKPCMTEIYLHI